MGRITTMIEDGSLFEGLGLPAWNLQDDRIMICGSLEMCKDVASPAEKAGLVEGCQ